MGAIFLYRGDNKHESSILIDHGVPVYYGGNITDAQVHNGDLNLGWATEMDASIMVQNPTIGVEVRYLGLAQWSESKSDSTYNLAYGQQANAAGKLKSALSNVELNLHWWQCANDRYSLLVGFRWLNLTDRLSIFWDDRYYNLGSYWKGAGSCRNNLYGGQLGVEGLLFGKRDQGFSLDGVVKAGVFENKMDNQGSWNYASSYYNYYFNGSQSWNMTTTAFLSELGLNLNYAFIKNIALTLG